MEEKLVSIITPCYNGEKYLDQYFSSLIYQNYSNCQIIFIDDGSTDNTKNIVFKYKSKIEEKGMKLEYYYQENEGQAAAIKRGIQLIQGEYFIWPDVDDIITPDSISKRVSFLEKNREYGLVRSDCKVIFENKLDEIIEFSAKKNKNQFKEELFINCLLMKNFYYQPGCYMVRTSTLIERNPNKYIFVSRAGQNIQMLLPVLYKQKCGYIDEPLYIYVRHLNSHSMSIEQNYETQVKRQNDFRNIIINTIKNTSIGQKEKFILMANREIQKRKIDLAYKYGKEKEIVQLYNTLKNEYKLFSLKYYLKSKLCNNVFFRKLLKSRVELIRIIKGKKNV